MLWTQNLSWLLSWCVCHKRLIVSGLVVVIFSFQGSMANHNNPLKDMEESFASIRLEDEDEDEGGLMYDGDTVETPSEIDVRVGF